MAQTKDDELESPLPEHIMVETIISPVLATSWGLPPGTNAGVDPRDPTRHEKERPACLRPSLASRDSSDYLHYPHCSLAHRIQDFGDTVTRNIYRDASLEKGTSP